MTFPPWGAAALCFVSAARGALAVAPVYTVNSFADVADLTPDGVCNTTADNAHPICTLRAAVMEANAYAGAGEVTISLQAGTYTLLIGPTGANDASTGDLNLTGHVTVVGKGKVATIVDANHLDRVFAAASGSVATFADLTVQGGRLGNGSGGGLASSGALTITRCLVRDNQSEIHGGGVASLLGGTLTITESEIRDNHAPSWGGGAFSYGSTTLISRTTIAGNTASRGGGIYAFVGPLKVVNSTVSGNQADDVGGGVTLEFLPSAIFNNVTIRENRVPGAQGGGFALLTSTLDLSNSILQNEDSLAFDDVYCDAPSSIASNGFNLIHVPTGCPIVGTYVTTQLQFTSLGDNGGPTPTMALPLLSPAIDTGSNTGCTDENGGPLLLDQRGVKRPIGTRCDLGAFEREPIGDANGDGVVSVSDVFYLINFLFAGGAAPLGRADVTGFNGAIDVADVFFLVNYLFASGQAPPSY